MRDVTPLLTAPREPRGAYLGHARTLMDHWFGFAGEQPNQFTLDLGPLTTGPCYGVHGSPSFESRGFLLSPDKVVEPAVRVDALKYRKGHRPSLRVQVDLGDEAHIVGPRLSATWGAVMDRYLYLKLKRRSRTPITLLTKPPLLPGERLCLTRGPEGVQDQLTSLHLPEMTLRHVCGEVVTTLRVEQLQCDVTRVRLGGHGVGMSRYLSHENPGAAQTTYMNVQGRATPPSEVVMQSFLTGLDEEGEGPSFIEAMSPYTAQGHLNSSPSLKEGSGFIDHLTCKNIQLVLRLDEMGVRSVTRAVHETFTPTI